MTTFLQDNMLFIGSVILLGGLVAGASTLQGTHGQSGGQSSVSSSTAVHTNSSVWQSPTSIHVPVVNESQISNAPAPTKPKTTIVPSVQKKVRYDEERDDDY